MEVNQPHLIDIQQWFVMQIPQPTLQSIRMEDHVVWNSLIQSDKNQLANKGCFRKRSMPASCFRQQPSMFSPNQKQSLDECSRSSVCAINNSAKSKTRKKYSWIFGNAEWINHQVKSSQNPKNDLNLDQTAKHSSSTNSCDSFRSSYSSCSTPNSQNINGQITLAKKLTIQLRLKIEYQTLDVLPLGCYDELKQVRILQLNFFLKYVFKVYFKIFIVLSEKLKFFKRL